MPSQKYQPRLSVEITDEQFLELQRLIPHGIKRQIFAVIVDDLLDLLRNSTKREAIFAAIINRLVNMPLRALEISNESGKDSS